MSYRILLLLAMILCVPGTARADDQPGFSLNFRFLPPMKVVGPVPTIMLDVCSDNYCNRLLQTVVLYCLAQSVNQQSPVFFNECSAQASITARGPDANLALLSRPAILRLRMNTLVSMPFNFRGGTPNLPVNRYIFDVGLSPSGFVISSG